MLYFLPLFALHFLLKQCAFAGIKLTWGEHTHKGCLIRFVWEMEAPSDGLLAGLILRFLVQTIINGFFFDSLIDNDEKVAFPKKKLKYSQFKTTMQKNIPQVSDRSG